MEAVTLETQIERKVETTYNPYTEPSSINFINEFVKDGNAKYCSARLVLKRLGSECPFGSGCQGRLWCQNRDEVYSKNLKRRFLTQLKLVEIYRYLEGLHGTSFEEFDKAYLAWVSSGAAVTFAEAYDNDGIRDLDTLKRLCAHAAVDAPYIRDPLSPVAA